MKTTFVLLIFFISFSFVKGQTYIPFPEDSAEWCFAYNTGCEDGPFYNGIYKYFFEDDTIIHDKTYHNIGITRTWYGKYDYSYYFPLISSSLTDTYLGKVGGLRTESKKVYFYRYPGILAAGGESFHFYMSDTLECLLYDFGINTGDTISLNNSDYDTIFNVVSIDSILLLDGLYHKAIHLVNGDGYYQTWVEGLGELGKGLFGSYIFEFECFNWNLNSFSKNGSDIYFIDSCDSHFIPHVIGFSSPAKGDVRIFPNPFTNQLTLTINSGQNNSILKLFNLSGEIVLEVQATQSLTINTKQFLQGVYFAVVFKNGVPVFTEKLIKL